MFKKARPVVLSGRRPRSGAFQRALGALSSLYKSLELFEFIRSSESIALDEVDQLELDRDLRPGRL
jgi:hypothetical protein